MQIMISPNRAKLNIAENLKRLMAQHGMSQMALADASGISQPFVHKMVHAKILPNALALYHVAEVLGVTVDALLENPPDENSEKSA